MNNMLWSSWQLCGDVHVLGTKVREREREILFSALLIIFRLQNLSVLTLMILMFLMSLIVK